MSLRRGVVVFVCAGFALVAPALSPAQEASEKETAAMPVARILPAVASTAGAGGSYFRTSLQLFNQYSSPLFGRLVFHRAGDAAATDDPGLNVTIPSGETVSYHDVLEAMGLSGLGTLDILMPSASTSPIVVARVFNDAGDDGTAGFTQEVVSPGESGPLARVLTAGKDGFLILPSNLEAFRFNLGIRVLSAGGWVQFLVFDAQGEVVADVGKSMPPYSFLQQEAGAFLGIELPPGGSMRVRPTAGSVIVYGATVDNVTQDPSIQFARSGS